MPFSTTFEYLIMEGPTWDLHFPSTPGFIANLSPNGELINNNNGRGDIIADRSGGSMVDTNMTPILKKSWPSDDETPMSKHTVSKFSGGSSELVGLSQKSEDLGNSSVSYRNDNKYVEKQSYPKVFLSPNSIDEADLAELHCSIYATIERFRKTYICIHDIVDYVSKKLPTNYKLVKWCHFDDKKFLFALQDKVARDRFILTYSNVLIGDAMVKFTPWKPAESGVVKPTLFKVWLRLTGLPIEQYNFVAVESVVCGFGRLYKCNMEKKKVFIGCFYVMIDCPDLDEIPPRVIVQPISEAEFVVFVDKIYANPLVVYNAEKFVEDQIGYDEVVATLIDRGKLVPLFPK